MSGEGRGGEAAVEGKSGGPHIFFVRLTSNLRARKNRSCVPWSVPMPLGSEKRGAGRGGISYQCQGIQALGITLGFQHQPQLVYLGLVLGSQMAWVTRDCNGGGRREVIVVVLGIELHCEVRFGHVCPAAVGKPGMEVDGWEMWRWDLLSMLLA